LGSYLGLYNRGLVGLLHVCEIDPKFIFMLTIKHAEIEIGIIQQSTVLQFY
jgi:hypothetical protein